MKLLINDKNVSEDVPQGIIELECLLTESMDSNKTTADIINFDTDEKYDAVIANHKFGIALNKYDKNFQRQIPETTALTFYQWELFFKSFSYLENDGRVVAFTTKNVLNNKYDRPARKYFIENGLIEAVIALPKKILKFTYVDTCILVFSRGNTSVRFIDAKNFFTQGRIFNSITPKDARKIYEAYNLDYLSFGNDRIADENYSLDMEIYTEYENTSLVPFKNIIKSVRRGAALTSKLLDDITVNEDTGFKYLRMSDIKNNIIEGCLLPNIRSVEKNFEKYTVKKNDLVISKIGLPVKHAVCRDENLIILANSSTYVIEIDSELADPYFLQSYFSSSKGQERLDRATSGSKISTLPVESLKNILIPLPSLEKQREIAKKYITAENKIIEIEKDLSYALEDIKNIY